MILTDIRFSDSETAVLREIFDFLTAVEIARRSLLLTDAQVARVKNLIIQWDAVNLETTRLVPTRIEGLDVDPTRTRELIRAYLATHFGVGVNYENNSATSSAALLSGLRMVRG